MFPPGIWIHRVVRYVSAPCYPVLQIRIDFACKFSQILLAHSRSRSKLDALFLRNKAEENFKRIYFSNVPIPHSHKWLTWGFQWYLRNYTSATVPPPSTLGSTTQDISDPTERHILRHFEIEFYSLSFKRYRYLLNSSYTWNTGFWNESIDSPGTGKNVSEHTRTYILSSAKSTHVLLALTNLSQGLKTKITTNILPISHSANATGTL